MEEPDKKRIQINFRVIVQSVRPTDIADFLFAKGVIDMDEMDMIDLPALTPRQKMVKLLRVLFKVQGSFPVFCDALKDIAMEWLVNKLEETDITVIEFSQDHTDATELDMQEKLALQEKILQQQSQFIDTLVLQNKGNSKKGESTPPVSELPDLKMAMQAQGLSEEQVVTYIEDLMKRKSHDTDDTDSASTTDSGRTRATSDSSVNFTETVAITTAVDVVKYLAYSEDKNKQLPKPNIYQVTMRRTVDELIFRHKQMFEAYISQESSVRQATGINFLLGIADEIFRDGQKNWGRIVALYAFGGWLAKHGIFERQDSVFDMIGDVLGFYVAKNLGTWIDSNGGWDSFLSQFPVEAPKRNSNYWAPALVGLGLALGTGLIATIASRQ